MPEKQRYMINVIPCNTGKLSAKLPKSRSVDDMDVNPTPSGVKEEVPSPVKLPGGPVVKELSKTLAEKHIAIIANRERNVERKNKKMKSKRSLTEVLLTSKLDQTLSSLRRQANFRISTEFCQGLEKEAMAKSSKYSTKRLGL